MILPGINYRFSAREVMDLLIENTGMSEQAAVDTVSEFALPRMRMALRQDIRDTETYISECQEELERLEMLS